MLTENIKSKVLEILSLNEIQQIINANEFYFEKAKEAYNKYINYKKEEVDFFQTLSILEYQEIQSLSETDEEVKEFLVRMERLISYCDTHAKGKNIYNEYEDKRVIARAGIYQNAWIAQLTKYRIDKSSIKLSIHNVFDFINSPDISVSIVSENHKRMISNNLFQKEYIRDTFVEEVNNFFQPLNIPIKNEINRTHLYTRLIYSLREIWYDIVRGLVARDNGEWKNELKEELINREYGIIWWNPRPVQANEILPKLEDKIINDKFFYIYYATYGTVTHRARVIDFSLAEDYDKKSLEWQLKDPAWFSDTAEGYQDEKRSASIIFLIDQFIETNPHFPIEDFQMYKGLSLPNRNNLSPYSTINNDLEIDNSTLIEDSTLYDLFCRTNFSLKDKNSIKGVIGVDDLAEELAEIIDKMSAEQGRMVGIFGEWGRGKTFFMDKLWEKLNEIQIRGEKNNNKENIKIDFHAWKYQDTPAIWAYLYEKFSYAYFNTDEKWLHKLIKRFKLNFKRVGYRSMIWFITTFIFTLIFRLIIPLEFKIQLITSIGVSTIISLALVYFSYKNPARELFRKYYTKPTFSNLLGIQAEVQKELKILIKTWSKKKKENFKIILFVDDIDRCSEDKIIQIIDSLRVMLEDEELCSQMIIITAIDERILKRAITLKYSDLLKNERVINEKQALATLKILVKEYLDKLFITGIKLGNLNPEEKDEIFLGITECDRKKDSIPIAFSDLYKENNDVKKLSLEPDEEDSSKEPNKFYYNERVSEVFEESIDLEEKITNKNSDLLSDDEVNMLRKNLQLYPKITPRQIRIFYYRYLIAKNLLIRQYDKIGRKNIWLSLENCSHFVELLIRLSEHDDPDIVIKQKQKVLETPDPKCTVELLKDIEFNTFDYKILIGVLETVIGY